MRYSPRERRIVRLRTAAVLAVCVLMLASVLAMSASAVTTTSPGDDATSHEHAEEHSPEDAPDGEGHQQNESEGEGHPENATDRPPENESAEEHAHVHLSLDDEGGLLTAEYDGDDSVVVTIDALDGTYAGTGTYEFADDGRVQLPAPDEPVTLEITVAVGDEEHTHRIPLDRAAGSANATDVDEVTGDWSDLANSRESDARDEHDPEVDTTDGPELPDEPRELPRPDGPDVRDKYEIPEPDPELPEELRRILERDWTDDDVDEFAEGAVSHEDVDDEPEFDGDASAVDDGSGDDDAGTDGDDGGSGDGNDGSAGA